MKYVINFRHCRGNIFQVVERQTSTFWRLKCSILSACQRQTWPQSHMGLWKWLLKAAVRGINAFKINWRVGSQCRRQDTTECLVASSQSLKRMWRLRTPAATGPSTWWRYCDQTHRLILNALIPLSAAFSSNLRRPIGLCVNVCLWFWGDWSLLFRQAYL